METLLKQYGYSVTTAVDGECALDFYKDHKDSINLVILDLTMPRMSGKMVLEQMFSINPDVKVILSSGQSEEDVREGIFDLAKGYTQKPYKLAELATMVRTVLDE